jgi:hypothetical protein
VSTPSLYLETSFILNVDGRILSTREPGASRGPLLTIVKSSSESAWLVRSGLPDELSAELDRLAREEPPASDLRDAPVHIHRYLSLLAGHVDSGPGAIPGTPQSDGPAFVFPAQLNGLTGVVTIEDERLLDHNFRGWIPGEIAGGRSPVLAIVADEHPVSVCFCARRSDRAAEAGLDTAAAYRGRGYAPLVTAAWAREIRAMGLVPLYSTAWTNTASLAVARKLGLTPYASTWSLSD